MLIAVALLLASTAVPAQLALSPEQRLALEALAPGTPGSLPPPTADDPAAARRGSGPTAIPLAPGGATPPPEPRITGGDTLVVSGRLREGFDPLEAGRFAADPNRNRLVGSRSYELDKDGRLALAGIGTIALAGLTAAEAEIRLEAEPLLAPLDMAVTLLPLTPTGAAALRPFGYDLFAVDNDAFRAESWLAAAPPRDYELGPGDVLRVQFFGAENYQVDLPVSPEGIINLPKIGPEEIAGLWFGNARELIERRVASQLVGTRAAVSLGRLRSVRVFVVGDVKRPGAYDVSSLARVTNVLFAAGGISEVGSLRAVQLKRGGRLVRTLDLYGLLLRGDTRNDARLEHGDVVLVPPAGPQVAVSGEVRRPAIYELSGEQRLADVLALAGGLQATADRRRVQLERIDPRGSRRLESVSLVDDGGTLALADGDVVRVLPVLADVQGTVTVDGHVARPGSVEWRPGLRASTLLPDASALLPRADLAYVLVRRERGADRRTEVLSVDLAAAQAAPGSAADLALEPRDRVTVFELGVARSAAIEAILREIELQATSDEPFAGVRVGGNVRAPGTYPLEPGMRLSRLVRAGGGLNPSAYGAAAELTRYSVGSDGERGTQLIDVDLAAALAGDPAADIELRPYDVLTIKEVPAWEERVEVEIAGEVRFPGRYPVRRGETLAAVLERAGGLTDLAFAEGSVFTRRFLQEREAKQLEMLRARLESDLAALAIQRANRPDAKADEAMGVGNSLLEQLKGTTAAGRLVIDLPAVLAHRGDLDYDIEVRDGDSLVIPPRSQEVTVLGEVQYATSHRYDPDLARDGYIALSGGTTARADEGRIYIVRANGAVIAAGKGFTRGRRDVQPGDTIVVPLATDRLPKLAQWSSITQIIYNLAIAVAAVNSF